VQKYLGEGPRMVRDVFRLAKENAPAIIFIDEVDAIATARFDAQTGADREARSLFMLDCLLRCCLSALLFVCDDVDDIATARFDARTGADRRVSQNPHGPA
jgi:ATP-dependent 26S proteasome regulatory subunit